MNVSLKPSVSFTPLITLEGEREQGREWERGEGEMKRVRERGREREGGGGGKGRERGKEKGASVEMLRQNQLLMFITQTGRRLLREGLEIHTSALQYLQADE